MRGEGTPTDIGVTGMQIGIFKRKYNSSDVAPVTFDPIKVSARDGGTCFVYFALFHTKL